MITIEGSAKDDRKPLVDIWGMSSNTKPVYKYGSLLLANASTYHENDTSCIYRYDETNQVWHKQKFRMYEDDDFKPKVTLWGLSTDTKPINKFGSLVIATGSVFYEMDTSDRYRYDAKTSSWYKQKPVSSGGGGEGDLDLAVSDGNLIFTRTDE